MARTKRKGNQKKQEPAQAVQNQSTNQSQRQAKREKTTHASLPNQVTNNQAQHEDPAIRLAELDEQVRLDELIVKDLMDRRTSLAEEIETTRLKRQRLLERAVLLKERSLHLRAAKIKYGTLQKNLQESLTKSRERLARLSSLEELGHEDVTSCENIALVDELQQSETADDAKSIESAKGSMDGNIQPQMTRQHHGLTVNETATLPPASRLRSCSIDLYRDFCWRHKHRLSLMPLLPVVDPSLMSRILSISMKEAKALDVIHKNPSDRRCLLWNTCLDLALLSIIKIETIDEDDDRTGPDAAVLDPNVFLCPYELAGICADDYCPYQHASKPMLPREQIPLPLLSLQPSHTNNAMVPMPAGTSLKATSTRKDPPGPKTSKDSAGNTSSSDDYIALPKPDTDNESDENGSDSDEDFDNYGISSLVTKGIHLSSSSSIQREGIIPSVDSSVEQLFQNYNHETFSTIFDAIRLYLHSGRFDMAHSLIEQETQPAWWKDLLQEVWYHCFQSPSKRISFIRTIFENQATLLVLSACGDGSKHDSDMKSLLKDVLANMWTPDIDSSTSMEFVISDFRNVLSGFHGIWKHAVQPFDAHFKFADLQKSILWARKVFDRLSSKTISLHRIDDHILKPCWFAVRRWVEFLNPDEMAWAGIKGTIVMGLIVLGCLESFSTLIHDDRLNASVAASLITVDRTVSNILNGLSKLFACVPMIELLLSPLYAANVATATFVRRYSMAYQRLVRLLAIKSHQHQRRPPGFLQFSELLWCQFLQLRMALPVAVNSELQDKKTTRSKRYSWELSAEVVNENEGILEKMENRGLRLLHIALTGDRVFAHALADGLSSLIDVARKQRLRVAASKILQSVYVESNQPDDTAQTLDLTGLPLHPSAHRSESVMPSTISSLPRSLMLVGHGLQKLNLSQCQLTSLPATFGLYFPNLLVRYFLL